VIEGKAVSSNSVPKYLRQIAQRQAIDPLPQQHGSAVRGQAIITSLDLDGPIERRLEKRPSAFTHWMNLHARSAVITKRSEQRLIQPTSSNAQGGTGRVEVRRGTHPFPHPAHRTGQAVFPHPALGQGVRPQRSSCSRPREVASQRRQPDQSQVLVQIRVGET